MFTSIQSCSLCPCFGCIASLKSKKMRVLLLYALCCCILLLYHSIEISAEQSLRVCLKEVSKKVYITDAKGKNLQVIKTKSLTVLPKPVTIGSNSYYKIIGNPPTFVLAKYFTTCVKTSKEAVSKSISSTQNVKSTATTTTTASNTPTTNGVTVAAAQVPYSVSNAFCFPIKGDSLTDIVFNFGSKSPTSKLQCHGAVDITTKGQHIVVSTADGTVMDVVNHDHNCVKGKQGKAILVYHKGFKKTLLYGGLDAASIKVKQGDAITKGQPLGTVAECRKLELEIYDGKVLNRIAWIAISKEQKQVMQQTDSCLKSPILSRMKPTAMEDPSIFLKNIRSLLC